MSADHEHPTSVFPPGRLLYPPEKQHDPTSAGIPACFPDLNLDQIVKGILSGRDDPALFTTYVVPLKSLEQISYRQAIFQDFESRDVRAAIGRFAAQTLSRRFEVRTKAMHDDDNGLTHYFRARMFLNDVKTYCEAVKALGPELEHSTLRSKGMRDFLAYLTGYLASESFVKMTAWSDRLLEDLADVTYCISIKGSRITVASYDDEADYSQQLAASLEQFTREQPPHQSALSREWDMYGATGVLELVAQLYPDLFASLDAFCAKYAEYPDRAVLGFEHDLHFYLSYLEYIAPLQDSGLTFGYPRISLSSKAEQALDTFDLALATTLHGDDQPVICNDLLLNDPERILVISGPNNGGKTTFARTFGQLHYLSRLGCPVPGHDIRLHLVDQIFTHFERDESGAHTGRLQYELDRLWADLQRATPHSAFILNEIFSSTTAHDALFLSRKVIEQLSDLSSLGVVVTFLDELSRMNAQTVSMVSMVVPKDPATRTHKVVRTPADGRAYAIAIADKYGLSFERLTREVLP